LEKVLPEHINLAINAALDKKGFNLSLLEVANLTSICDYFLIVSANSTIQVQAIVDNIEEKLSEIGRNPLRLEGKNAARWVLMDYGDLVVHVFIEEEREFYDLERLWRTSENYLQTGVDKA